MWARKWGIWVVGYNRWNSLANVFSQCLVKLDILTQK